MAEGGLKVLLRKRLHSCTWALVSLLAIAAPAKSQGFGVGLKVGVPMTEYFSTGFLPHPPLATGTQYTSTTHHYTVGITAEWLSSRRIGAEVDLEYKRVNYVHNEPEAFPPLSGLSGPSIFTVTGSSWDIPILMKYRFRKPGALFLSGGLTLRHLGPVRARGTIVSTDLLGNTNIVQIDTSLPQELSSRDFYGGTVSAGFEFGAGRLHFLPELRYTRWASNIETADGALRFDPNEVELFLGLLFHRR